MRKGKRRKGREEGKREEGRRDKERGKRRRGEWRKCMRWDPQRTGARWACRMVQKREREREKGRTTFSVPLVVRTIHSRKQGPKEGMMNFGT